VVIDEELPARAVRRRVGGRLVTASGAACLMARKDMSGLLTPEARRQLFRALLGGGGESRLALGATLTVDSAAICWEARPWAADGRVSETRAPRGRPAMPPVHPREELARHAELW
jgi:hypothetical protein